MAALVAAAGLGAAAALGAVTATSAPNMPVPAHRGSANRALAPHVTARLLTRLRLPAGATPSAVEPVGDRGELAHPAVTPTGNLVDRELWWVVPESAAAADGFVRANSPADGRLSLSGSAGNGSGPPSQLFEGFGWPAVRGRLSLRQLVIAIAPLAGGGSGVRVDAQAVWITPRPAGDRIPRGATRLLVELRHGTQVVAGPFTYGARSQLRRVRRLVNSLPSAQPGALSCPNDTGYDVRLTFAAASRRPLAVVDADPQGCEGVALTVRGRPQAPLTSQGFPGSGRSPRRPLIGQLDQLLGLRLARKLMP